jgi:hypothetical protein
VSTRSPAQPAAAVGGRCKLGRVSETRFSVRTWPLGSTLFWGVKVVLWTQGTNCAPQNECALEQISLRHVSNQAPPLPPPVVLSFGHVRPPQLATTTASY